MKPKRVEIVEVGPRDGLQNEASIVSTDDKLALIERLVAAGLRRIEVTSFVNPAKVPRMADAEELCRRLPRRDDVTWVGLVLNAKGARRAIDAGLDELGAVVMATDSFGLRNQGRDREGTLEVARAIMAEARDAGRAGQITISAAFGCPYEGEVPAERVIDLARRAADARPREIALADTIGVAVPAQVTELVERVRAAIEPLPVRAHFHNTRSLGAANTWAAILAGASTVDASLGGLGGCPFAPNATGNVATEDVAYMLARSGIATGIDLAALIEAERWFAGVIGRDLPGMVSKAGDFPGALGRTDAPADKEPRDA